MRQVSVKRNTPQRRRRFRIVNTHKKKKIYTAQHWSNLMFVVLLLLAVPGHVRPQRKSGCAVYVT